MVTCPRCGESNSERAKFCSECAAPLGGVGASERRERRVVTVLFADLAGFTRRSEGLDVEDVEGFLDPYVTVLRKQVERTGGVVAKFTGDGVMALFGAVAAHEDDPERAVRCGLAVCERMGELGGELHVRVGITTGEVLVMIDGDGHADAIGDVVNTAARLESAAPLDGVLVDGWTYRASSREIEYRPGEPVAAKGKAEPVPAWIALAPRSIVPERRRDRLPLVGREAESAALRDAFERSRGVPVTQLVTIIGPPGIGKTRLVEDLHDHVDAVPELVTWRRGRSLAYGGSAVWALGEVVKSQAGILESDDAIVAGDKLRDAVERLVEDERDRIWVARELGPLVGLDAASGPGEGDRVEAFAAWRRFVEALADDGPTVLVFEDIHWADDALLDFIELVFTHSVGVPLLIVCTARPELAERRPKWATALPHAITISPRPLAEKDMARLVSDLLDQAQLPTAVGQTLLDEAEGNPLYVQEYVRMLRDRGILTVMPEGGWELTGDVRGLPESIHGIIAARLDTLSADEKAIVQDAAVVGRTAWVGALAALADRQPDQVEALLAGVERKQLVHRMRRSTMAGEIEYTFSHALTRDVAYSQIRRPDRARKHLAAAGWIEALPGLRDDRAELLAGHYSQAMELQEQMGEDTAAVRPLARAAHIEAGDHAAATYAHHAATHHYRAALGLTDADDFPARAELLLSELTARYSDDSWDQSLLDTALEAQVSCGHWEGAARVERMYGKWCEHRGLPAAQAEEHRRIGAQYAARVPPSNVMCHIASDQAFAMTLSGRASGAVELAGSILPLADAAGLHAGRAHLLMTHGVALSALGDPQGVRDMRTAAEILIPHPDRRIVDIYGNLADALRGLGDMSGANAAYESGLEWGRRLAEPDTIEWIVLEQAYQAYHAGEWNAAERRLGECDPPSNEISEGQVRTTRGRLQLARGRIDEALEDARALEAFAVSSANDEFHYYGVALRARCFAAAGDEVESGAACDRFLDRWQTTGGFASRAIELCEIATTLAIEGRHDQIRKAGLLLPEASRWRAPILLVARHRYAEAAGTYELIGSRPLAADAHLLAADQACREGRESDAVRHAQAVREFAERTGASLYARWADQHAEAAR
jgi:class 3 adenylate cyclase/tetratricopeptide (TPR) repeat protein